MRKGYDSAWLMDGSTVVGVSLGSDFTAEHEWYIEPLQRRLGIVDDLKVLGIERRRINKPNLNEVFFFQEDDNNAVLVVTDSYLIEKYKDMKKIEESKYFSDELRFFKEEDLATAWSRDDFGIRVRRPVNVKKLIQLHKAIENKDAGLWYVKNGFKNPSLFLGIISRVSKEMKQELYDVDLDQNKLTEAAAATGIVQRINDVNNKFTEQLPKGHFVYDTPKGYLALSPKWLSKDKQSKYPVMYWLNPREQKKHNAGWFTVEELEEWLEGKGPVVKQ